MDNPILQIKHLFGRKNFLFICQILTPLATHQISPLGKLILSLERLFNTLYWWTNFNQSNCFLIALFSYKEFKTIESNRVLTIFLKHLWNFSTSKFLISYSDGVLMKNRTSASYCIPLSKCSLPRVFTEFPQWPWNCANFIGRSKWLALTAEKKNVQVVFLKFKVHMNFVVYKIVIQEIDCYYAM